MKKLEPPPSAKSLLMYHKDFGLYCPYERPNIWFRFWQYVLLGFRWKDVN